MGSGKKHCFWQIWMRIHVLTIFPSETQQLRGYNYSIWCELVTELDYQMVCWVCSAHILVPWDTSYNVELSKIVNVNAFCFTFKPHFQILTFINGNLHRQQVKEMYLHFTHVYTWCYTQNITKCTSTSMHSCK